MFKLLNASKNGWEAWPALCWPLTNVTPIKKWRILLKRPNTKNMEVFSKWNYTCTVTATKESVRKWDRKKKIWSWNCRSWLPWNIFTVVCHREVSIYTKTFHNLSSEAVQVSLERQLEAKNSNGYRILFNEIWSSHFLLHLNSRFWHDHLCFPGENIFVIINLLPCIDTVGNYSFERQEEKVLPV